MFHAFIEIHPVASGDNQSCTRPIKGRIGHTLASHPRRISECQRDRPPLAPPNTTVFRLAVFSDEIHSFTRSIQVHSGRKQQNRSGLWTERGEQA